MSAWDITSMPMHSMRMLIRVKGFFITSRYAGGTEKVNLSLDLIN
jgi:hypothetical protein